MAQQLRTSSDHSAVIVSKQHIEQQARRAVQQGQALNDACPYPPTTEAGLHFAAVYLVAQAAARAAQRTAQPA
ncbi:hypothetical protein [Paracidovorax wautersii]|uniref:Uncharacterized protein n=1 Tax=Paracidovorax wautersii TaxID=1177982 RepID=A0A1I2E6W1_9BURK|nr:hypothetical protein [Paracidovorax wautersii]SFE88218.1 hypothetical protein SAMN04489711_106247 [Paracidovorax wautersii]